MFKCIQIYQQHEIVPPISSLCFNVRFELFGFESSTGRGGGDVRFTVFTLHALDYTCFHTAVFKSRQIQG